MCHQIRFEGSELSWPSWAETERQYSLSGRQVAIPVACQSRDCMRQLGIPSCHGPNLEIGAIPRCRTTTPQLVEEKVMVINDKLTCIFVLSPLAVALQWYGYIKISSWKSMVKAMPVVKGVDLESWRSRSYPMVPFEANNQHWFIRQWLGFNSAGSWYLKDVVDCCIYALLGDNELIRDGNIV